MRRVVRGFWGPREESVEALAGRWKRTLDRLAELLPAADPGAADGTAGAGGAPWTWQQVQSEGPATALRADEPSLLAALRAVQAADGWTDTTGTGLSLVAGNAAGWRIDTGGRAGGTSEFLLQAVLIGIEAPDGAEVPDAALLAAVAEIWEPDFGGVTDDDVLDTLEDDGDFDPDEPSVGWVGHLSPARAALLPDELAVTRTELPDGGALLDIAPRSDTEAVLAANLRLRDAGALEPLPRPMARALL
ncbi:hypothetical protein [Streptomyces sp. NPDC058045]|uniref:hypothetical protein n=1 Tax=Streptomyces sp. NPDC058045 TaxID=3346311 RepID=UPI0036EC5C33